MFSKKEPKDLALEEALNDSVSGDLDVVEVPIGQKPFFYLGAAIILLGIIVAGRIIYLNVFQAQLYTSRAQANLSRTQEIFAPRGLIYDRNGEVLAENTAAFAAVLNAADFAAHKESQEATLQTINDILGISADDILKSIGESGTRGNSSAVVLAYDLSQEQIVQIDGANLPALWVESEFERKYDDGSVFASVIGYVGRASAADMKNNPNITSGDFVGKDGVEAFYDQSLRGENGTVETVKNSQGQVLSEKKKSDPVPGSSLKLTIDGEFQRYFYERLQEGLWSLGKRIGAGIAVNPQNGEVLALVNLPSFDPNVLSGPGRNDKKVSILNSKDKPLFNRVVSGYYSPGSTIKPLVGVAALAEGVIDPNREIFSPGYMDFPNPYNASETTRYLDWRYQGNVNLASAIAQSSDVYFYLVGGGSPPKISPPEILNGGGAVKGLGISRLIDWWKKFGLGAPTGIDLPGEADGFIPTPDWKKTKTKKPWLLGDTYNVSIGQGDLLLSPMQLISYIGAIGNGGKIYEPFLNFNAGQTPKVSADLSKFQSEIRDVQKGMIQAVTSPMGTAHSLADLGFSIGAKTGSAQVMSNTQENAWFVGYAPAFVETSADAKALVDKSAGKPAEQPQIVVLVLVENSKEGSLNAVPIAKDVLNWYYWNRIRK